MMSPRPAMMLLLLGACAPTQDSPCQTSQAPVPIAANTAVGTPESLLELVLGQEQHTLRGPSIGAVPLQLQVSWTGEDAAWADREVNGDFESTDLSEDSHVCSDALVVPVDLAFATADGGFDELWSVQLISTVPGRVVLDHEVDANALHGDWRPDVQGYDSVFLRVHIEWTDEGSEGVLTAIARPDGGGAEQVWDVAVWPG